MLSNIRNLILDLDGVLWHGHTPLPDLPDFFASMDRLGIGLVLATNNATNTAAQFSNRLARYGVDFPQEMILTSAETTALYLQEHFPPQTAVFAVGAAGLHDALTAKGLAVVSTDEAEKGATAEVVVVAMAPDAHYRDLAMASLLVHGGAKFIGTNIDPSFPSERGPLPGAGALLALVATTTGVEPLTMGKPSPVVFEEALHRLGSQKHDTAMVGDRLTTDIAGAQGAGLPAILVLSGIATREDLAQTPHQPEFVFEDIHDLARAMAHAANEGPAHAEQQAAPDERRRG